MKTFSKRFKIPSKYLLLGIALIIGCLLCIGLLMLSSRGYFADPGIPILNKDVVYLCAKLEAEDEPICTEKKKIYPADFSPLLSNRFETVPWTYQDVQIILSKFQTNFEDNQNLHNFVGHYDLNRDGISDLSIYFDGTLEDNTLDVILFREEVGF